MTLHWWMHWFWITYHFYACTCDMVGRINNNSTTTMLTLNGTENSVGKLIYIPPIPISLETGYSNSTFLTPAKLHKTPKKHESSTNSTNKAVVTTEYPLIKETTVIEQNFTEIDSNITENQTLINITNRLGNTSYLSSDSVVNQSTIVNYGRIEDKTEKKPKGSLSAAGITGITLGCISIIGIICAVSFIICRNYEFNRPQVLNDRCSNPDSSGYIDDSTVRENSEEMYSLDNDSFLNSLEAMTIQNLWTDTVKHTKL